MNVLGLASECSSGYESGWTNYLDQSFFSVSPSLNGFKDRKSSFFDKHGEINGGKEVVDNNGDDDDDEEEEKEEDLSMVSDASSGPPHFYEGHDGYCNDDNQYQYTLPEVAALDKNGGKTHINNKEHRRRREDHQELPSFLDDTASSTLISFSKKNFARTNNQASMESAIDYSQDFSATHFQGVPAFHGHFGSSQSSSSGNQLQINQSKWF